MAIPELQLQTWSKYGAQKAAATMYNSVCLALPLDSPILKKWSCEIYLQGSYRNDTNIRADSDVDVIVQFNTPIWRSPRLSPFREEDVFFEAVDRVYGVWQQYRSDVLASLIHYFGRRRVDDSGNNSLKVRGDANRLNADVIPCFLYYSPLLTPSGRLTHSLIPGIQYFTQEEGRIVINYPKAHYRRGVLKNKNTNSRFKPTVRVFKNARKYLVERGFIDEDLAASYFIQCLLYNAPDLLFAPNFQMTFFNILKWLQTSNMASFRCQNGQTDLFGDSPQFWSVEKADQFIDALVDLWNNW